MSGYNTKNKGLYNLSAAGERRDRPLLIPMILELVETKQKNHLMFSIWLIKSIMMIIITGQRPRLEEITVLDFDIVVSEFELYSCHNVHFRTNTFELIPLGKGMNPLIHLVMC